MSRTNFYLIKSILAFGLVGLPVTAQKLWANTDVQVALQPGDPIYDLWDQFYKLEKTQSTQAEQVLLQLSQKTPQDIRVWKSLTYLQINLKKPEAALVSLEKARALAPNDEELTLQHAYLLNSLGRNDQALVIFKQLQNSKDAKTREIASQAVQNLQGSTAGDADLYFADIYFSPSYEDRFGMGLFPLKIRAGRYFGEGQQGQAYGFASINRDTQSEGNTNPEILGSNALIYDENAAVLGLGVSYQPWLNLPIRAYAEVGGSYDLIDRNRSKFRESIVAGATGYQEWYMKDICADQKCPNWYSDLYGNIASYSREDYAILSDLRLRSGVNFDKVGIKLYGKFHAINDTAHEYYNNLVEAGPGISWQPTKSFPMTLSVEKLYGKYVTGTPTSVKDTYDNTRIELTIYYGF